MKRISFQLLNIIIFSTLSIAVTTTSEPVSSKNDAHKIALIVAIGDYPQTHNWSKISSVNDIALIKSALKHHGFEEEHIKVLKDEEATKKNIEKAFREHLIGKAQEGGIAVFHFSGHGQQIADDNGDEGDGKDEALIPYGAHSVFKKGVYEGEHHLRDDELGKWLNELRGKLGKNGNVLVNLDACYSGTATRAGMSQTRGARQPFYPEGFDPKLFEKKEQKEEYTGLEVDEVYAGKASLVVFSGAKQDEENWETFDDEGTKVGSLSLAFSRQLVRVDSISYLELYEMIREDMASYSPRQTPQIEGDTEKYLFSGLTNPRATSSIIVEEVVNGGEVLINAGLLAGIRKGAEISFYDYAANIEEEKPINTGTVSESNIIFSRVELDKRAVETMIKGKKAVITSFGTGSLTTRVALAFFNEKDFGKSMKERLQQFPAVEIVESVEESALPDLILTDSTFEAAKQRVVRGNELFSSIKLYDSQGQDLLTTTDEGLEKIKHADLNGFKAFILEKIGNYHTSAVFTSLETSSRGQSQKPQISLSVVPVKYGWDGDVPIVKEIMPLVMLPGGGPKLYANKGEVFVIKLKNNSDRLLYYNVLQMDANHHAEVIIPNKKLSASDRFLKAGEEKLITDPEYFFVMTEPLGPQQFKVVATDREFYLGDDLTRLRAQRTRGASALLKNYTFIAVDNEVLEILE